MCRAVSPFLAIAKAQSASWNFAQEQFSGVPCCDSTCNFNHMKRDVTERKIGTATISFGVYRYWELDVTHTTCAKLVDEMRINARCDEAKMIEQYGSAYLSTICNVLISSASAHKNEVPFQRFVPPCAMWLGETKHPKSGGAICRVIIQAT